MLPGRWGQWAGPVATAWLLGPGQWQLPSRRWRWCPEPLVGHMCVLLWEWGQQVALSCRAFLTGDPWGDWGCRQCLFMAPLVLESSEMAAVVCTHPHHPHKRCPSAWEPAHAQRKMFLWWSCLFFSFLPKQRFLASPAGLGLLPYSLGSGTLLPSHWRTAP